MTGVEVVEAMREKCAKEWPSDFRMQVYCRERHVEAMRKMAQRPMQSGTEKIIRGQCYLEWGKDHDWQMQNFCEERQLEALPKLVK